MSAYEMKMPDLGEGIAEAEIVAWLVDVGDEVTTETAIVEVLTDKATVEVTAPVVGTVAARVGDAGDMVAVGSPLITIDAAGDAAPETEADPGSGSDAEKPAAGDQAAPVVAAQQPSDAPSSDAAAVADAPRPTSSAATASRVLAAPAVRARAATLGLDLGSVAGTGPGGRVGHDDLDRLLTNGAPRSVRSAPASADGTQVIPVRGVRRQIAQRLSVAWAKIPHITYVDAVDATELERLRAELNRQAEAESSALPRLTLLPFIARAVVLACADQPTLNAHHDHKAETVTVHDAVHLGIATQTDEGLRVPVVRHAESRTLRQLAAEIGRLADASRDGSASRDELSGSTITITSLGALGGLVTTPIINPPEVAIIGVNKIQIQPLWRNGSFEPRSVFNLSSSFDHRIIDGWDAATFINRIKTLLETPALLFIDD